MIAHLKQSWQRFKQSKPGERFQDQHHNGSSGQSRPVMRVLRMALGIVITLVGLVLMPAPGPGMLIVALGLAMLAHESLIVAKALDRAELWARPYALRVLGWWKEKRRR